MSISFLEALGILLFCYTALPTLWGRTLSLGVFSKGNKKHPFVALTFDDGPDPQVTPQLLAILKEHGIKATFFLVGQHAAENPALVRRIKAEGHSLGTHGFGHKFAWFQGPIGSIREISKGNEVIRQITGENTQFFRPAWGVFNLFSFFYPRFKGQKLVLWSLMSWDWSPRYSSNEILNSVTRNIRPGSVIILHDRCTKPIASDNGPTKMLEPCLQ
ncbi:hypothetical protein N752_15095 [Desulforamulus aquiferis]|nr:polysaccharide deacetylase family protein [Desulforamulus aquiferis]RYD04697.1 hypothetical protein N752_15095 [Desulforamulus aquiferis]